MSTSKLSSRVSIDSLESRTLLSGHHMDMGFGFGGFGHAGNTILFSQAPDAVKTGLTDLATKDNVAAPTDSQKVFLGNSNGIESYSVTIIGTGTRTRLTVDQNGNPVTAPTRSSTTFGAITNAAVTDEINAIATALSLTAPTADAKVNVSTPAVGTATYSIRLSDSSDTGWWHHGKTVTLDSNGNPVGNQRLPFSVMPKAIQDGLNAGAPAGATPLDATATDDVQVKTLNGVTTYSVEFTSAGTDTKVTVDASGKAADLPSRSTVQFKDVPTAAQTEIQTLATADNVTGTIDPAQNVTAYDEANGTTVYSVRLKATDPNDSTRTYRVTISVDQDGNPTVPPAQCGPFVRGGFGGGFSFGGGGFSFGFGGGSHGGLFGGGGFGVRGFLGAMGRIGR